VLRIALDKTWPEVITALQDDDVFRAWFANVGGDARPKYYRHAPYRSASRGG
jgi:hypothetical protein